MPEFETKIGGTSVGCDPSADLCFDVTQEGPLDQSIAPDASADQFRHAEPPAIPVISRAVTPQTGYAARIQSRSASQSANEFAQMAENLTTIGQLKSAYIQGGLSFEGLQGTKEILERITGKPIPEGEWPASGSGDSDARILSFLDGAERILKGDIVTFLRGLVDPKDAVGKGGLLNRFNIDGIQASYPHLLNELLAIDDTGKFLERTAVVASYAEGVSVASGLSSLLEYTRALKKEADDSLHMNPFALLGIAGNTELGAQDYSSVEGYNDFDPKIVKAKIEDLERSIFEAQSLLAQGRAKDASSKLYIISQSGKIKEITDALKLNGTMHSLADFQLSVSSVMISGAVASIAATYAGYGLTTLLGTSKLASYGVGAGKLVTEALAFTVSSRVLNAAFLQEELYDTNKTVGENVADFGLEVLSNAGMFLTIGVAMKAYQSTIMKGLQLAAARSLVSKGTITIEEIMTPAAQQLIVQEASLGKLGKALYELGGFGFEVLAFQEYEYIKGTLDKELLGMDVDPDAAFSPEAIKQSVMFLGALRFGRLITSPINENINSKLNEKIGEKFGPRLQRITERVRENIELIKEFQEGRRTDVDPYAMISEVAGLAAEKLQVMREMAAFGLCSPVDVALAEAQFSLLKNGAEWVKGVNVTDSQAVSREPGSALSLRSASTTPEAIQVRGAISLTGSAGEGAAAEGVERSAEVFVSGAPAEESVVTSSAVSNLERWAGLNQNANEGAGGINRSMTPEDRAMIDEILWDPNTPNYVQGSTGTCYLLSTLFSFVRLDHAMPLLARMIMPVKGGWVVTFPKAPDRQIFVERSKVEGSRTFIDGETSQTRVMKFSEGDLLFRILEYAYGRFRNPDADESQAIIATESGFEIDFLQNMMGYNTLLSDWLVGADLTNSNVVRLLTMLHENPDTWMVTAGINDAKLEDAPYWVKTYHSYSVTDYDPKTGQVTLRDPHSKEPFRTSLDEFNKYFIEISYGVLYKKAVERSLGGRFFGSHLYSYEPFIYDLFEGGPVTLRVGGSKYRLYYSGGDDGIVMQDGVDSFVHIATGASLSYATHKGRNFTIQNRGGGRVIITNHDSDIKVFKGRPGQKDSLKGIPSYKITYIPGYELEAPERFWDAAGGEHFDRPFEAHVPYRFDLSEMGAITLRLGNSEYIIQRDNLNNEIIIYSNENNAWHYLFRRELHTFQSKTPEGILVDAFKIDILSDGLVAITNTDRDNGLTASPGYPEPHTGPMENQLQYLYDLRTGGTARIEMGSETFIEASQSSEGNGEISVKVGVNNDGGQEQVAEVMTLDPDHRKLWVTSDDLAETSSISKGHNIRLTGEDGIFVAMTSSVPKGYKVRLQSFNGVLLVRYIDEAQISDPSFDCNISFDAPVEADPAVEAPPERKVNEPAETDMPAAPAPERLPDPADIVYLHSIGDNLPKAIADTFKLMADGIKRLYNDRRSERVIQEIGRTDGVSDAATTVDRAAVSSALGLPPERLFPENSNHTFHLWSVDSNSARASFSRAQDAYEFLGTMILGMDKGRARALIRGKTAPEWKALVDIIENGGTSGPVAIDGGRVTVSLENKGGSWNFTITDRSKRTAGAGSYARFSGKVVFEPRYERADHAQLLFHQMPSGLPEPSADARTYGILDNGYLHCDIHSAKEYFRSEREFYQFIDLAKAIGFSDPMELGGFLGANGYHRGVEMILDEVNANGLTERNRISLMERGQYRDIGQRSGHGWMPMLTFNKLPQLSIYRGTALAEGELARLFQMEWADYSERYDPSKSGGNSINPFGKGKYFTIDRGAGQRFAISKYNSSPSARVEPWYSVMVEARVPTDRLRKDSEMATWDVGEFQYDPTVVKPEDIVSFTLYLRDGAAVKIPGELLRSRDRSAVEDLLRDAGVPEESIGRLLVWEEEPAFPKDTPAAERSRTQTEMSSRRERISGEFLATMPPISELADGFVRYFRGDTSVDIFRLYGWLNVSRAGLAGEVWNRIEKKMSGAVDAQKLERSRSEFYTFTVVWRGLGYDMLGDIDGYSDILKVVDRELHISETSGRSEEQKRLALLQERVLEKGRANGIAAHGVELGKGGFDTLARIMIGGILDGGGIGPLAEGPAEWFAGPHGPFYVILNDRSFELTDRRGYATGSGGNLVYPEDAHLAYLVPNEVVKKAALDVIEGARRKGMLTDEEAANIEGKVITYEEFLTMDVSRFVTDISGRFIEPRTEWGYHDPEGVHGLGHTSRVEVLAETIADKITLNGGTPNMKVVRWAAVLHDVGRVEDKRDIEHGKRSAAWIREHLKELDPGMTDAEVELVAHIAEWHVPSDQEYPGEMPLELKIIKDADSLDRVRLSGEHSLDPRFLRTPEAVELQEMAKFLFSDSNRQHSLDGRGWVDAVKASLETYLSGSSQDNIVLLHSIGDYIPQALEDAGRMIVRGFERLLNNGPAEQRMGWNFVGEVGAERIPTREMSPAELELVMGPAPVSARQGSVGQGPEFKLSNDEPRMTFGRAATHIIPEFERGEGQPSVLSREQVLVYLDGDGAWRIQNTGSALSKNRLVIKKARGSGSVRTLHNGEENVLEPGRYVVNVVGDTEVVENRGRSDENVVVQPFVVSRFVIEIPSRYGKLGSFIKGLANGAKDPVASVSEEDLTLLGDALVSSLAADDMPSMNGSNEVYKRLVYDGARTRMMDSMDLVVAEVDLEMAVASLGSFFGGDGWFRWFGNRSLKTSGRIYFNVNPAEADKFVEDLHDEVLVPLRDNIKEFKIICAGSKLAERTDPSVLYFNKGHQQEVLDAVTNFYLRHPEYTKDAIPQLTAQLVDGEGRPMLGIAFGEQPTSNDHSFNSLRRDAIKEALSNARGRIANGEMLTWDDVMGLVLESFTKFGIDPERPEFNSGSEGWDYIREHTTYEPTDGMLLGSGGSSHMRAEIVSFSGERIIWPEGKKELVIGRLEGSDIRVQNDPTCSRRQARLIKNDDGSMSLEHLGKNQTLVEILNKDGTRERNIGLDGGHILHLEPGKTYKVKASEGARPIRIDIVAIKP